ncbi:MAG: type II toxin-antitoxin system VapC family toxin [Candidatus Bathyarchaeota archaeon]|nr:type II toxin-antitoxin system VapC family toxin [Candidatus Bathyarchaeota archaeon]
MTLRFIDSNVFLHAFLKPRRILSDEERKVKDQSKIIIGRLEAGEEVYTTTVHLSEVLNIVESGLGLEKSLGFLAWVISTDNIMVSATAIEDYEGAIGTAKEEGISPNDAIAYNAMKSQDITEIYSFDKHFNQLKDIKRIME